MGGSHAINLFLSTNHRFCAVDAHSFGVGGPGQFKEPLVISVVYYRNVRAVVRLHTSTCAFNLGNKLEIETLLLHIYLFFAKYKK